MCVCVYSKRVKLMVIGKENGIGTRGCLRSIKEKIFKNDADLFCSTMFHLHLCLQNWIITGMPRRSMEKRPHEWSLVSQLLILGGAENSSSQPRRNNYISYHKHKYYSAHSPHSFGLLLIVFSWKRKNKLSVRVKNRLTPSQKGNQLFAVLMSHLLTLFSN